MIRMEVWMDQISLYKNYTITISNDLGKVHSIEEKMKTLHLISNQIRLIKENNTITICWLIKGHKANHQKFIQALLHESSVLKLEV